VIPYRAMLDVRAELLRYVSRLLAAERRRRGTPARSRRLTCRDQAILALRWFRDRTRIEALGRDHGVSRATACRYVAEAVDVLSEQAPGLAEALERAMAEDVPYVILDGKIFESDRCSEPLTSVKGEQIDAWYSGKARRHGGNVQAVTRPDGLPLWAGPAEPGSVHDVTAARWHALPALYRAASLGMPALADSGYEGAGKGPRQTATGCPVTGAESSALGTGWIGSGQDASAGRRAWPKRSQRGSAGTLTTAQIKTSGVSCAAPSSSRSRPARRSAGPVSSKGGT
jgi:hypothetical protein